MRTHIGAWRWWVVGVGFLAVVGLLGAGCAAYEPFEPGPIGEIPPGPGLLTGKTGEFSVVRDGEFLPQLKGATSRPAAPETAVPGRKTAPQ